MTVIAGYLGAGKTTLINRLLAQDHGLKLMIMVNDFGAINIDEHLLASRTEDTIALTNGCVCCTMGADLYLAIGDVLDRRPRPDHLIIEASGVADPSQIASAAIAEPDLAYAGIVTVVDAQSIDQLTSDAMIGQQVKDQIRSADLVYISKLEKDQALPSLGALTTATILADVATTDLMDLISLDLPTDRERTTDAPAHPSYAAWQSEGSGPINIASLRSALARRPPALFRVKGSVFCDDQKVWTVQVVGKHIDIQKSEDIKAVGLVGIGVQSQLNQCELNDWWSTIHA